MMLSDKFSGNLLRRRNSNYATHSLVSISLNYCGFRCCASSLKLHFLTCSSVSLSEPVLLSGMLHFLSAPFHSCGCLLGQAGHLWTKCISIGLVVVWRSASGGRFNRELISFTHKLYLITSDVPSAFSLGNQM
ncbi:hypothetical protein CDAR_390521 [Caerostris darwini]|uniref:Uncharacterized protein n=1 Tax=Caerostris darwini TaxID=1538125 RepID=A0AAV4T6G1_9ARAC|nr:hypothetical protein CDAR_390521 [Caerostris darwini]